MRTYYSIMRPNDFDVLRDTNDKLREKMRKFNNKHSNFGFTYFVLGGWGHSEYLNHIFAYQENDTLYEFFSGYKIGQIEYNSDIPETATRITVNGEVFPTIFLRSEGDGYCHGRILSASQFAHDVKPHTKERLQLSRIMQKYFNICHEAWLTRNANRALEEKKKNARDTYDAGWLESFLDKR